MLLIFFRLMKRYGPLISISIFPEKRKDEQQIV